MLTDPRSGQISAPYGGAARSRADFVFIMQTGRRESVKTVSATACTSRATSGGSPSWSDTEIPEIAAMTVSSPTRSRPLRHMRRGFYLADPSWQDVVVRVEELVQTFRAFARRLED
jgi:hypothetical protein